MAKKGNELQPTIGGPGAPLILVVQIGAPVLAVMAEREGVPLLSQPI
jgi:hypothetical protein